MVTPVFNPEAAHAALGMMEIGAQGFDVMDRLATPLMYQHLNRR